MLSQNPATMGHSSAMVDPLSLTLCLASARRRLESPRRLGGLAGATIKIYSSPDQDPQRKIDVIDLEEISCGYGGGGRGLHALL
jgi:hypothetical protein